MAFLGPKSLVYRIRQTNCGKLFRFINEFLWYRFHLTASADADTNLKMFHFVDFPPRGSILWQIQTQVPFLIRFLKLAFA